MQAGGAAACNNFLFYINIKIPPVSFNYSLESFFYAISQQDIKKPPITERFQKLLKEKHVKQYLKTTKASKNVSVMIQTLYELSK
jgi:hypothetical protein